jgi:hypothetical protein
LSRASASGLDPEVLHKNAASLVADWDGDIDDITTFVGTVRDADAYDPA